MNLEDYVTFRCCIDDLINDPAVRSMNQYIQHSSVTTLEHCVLVSYISFSICKSCRLNYSAAARGALLHDMFLYDWHVKDESRKGLHGYLHPKRALENAKARFALNVMEQDIIVKHMWPLTLPLPKYRESFVVTLADKLACCIEVMGFYKIMWIRRVMRLKYAREALVMQMIEERAENVPTEK